MGLSNDEWVLLPEASKYLGVSRNTLDRWLTEHDIRHMRISAGQDAVRHTTLIYRPSLEAFIAKNTVSPEPTPKRKPGRPATKINTEVSND